MLKTLAIKELREIVGIAVLALAANLALVSSLTGLGLFSWMPAMPQAGHEVPFAGSAFASGFTIVSAACAIALGFRQSVWEAGRGTYLFLLHRPVSREAIFLTKLATGIGLFLVGAALPVLLFAWWAATPGHHPSPFEWSMTDSSWRLWAVLPIFYLGAFLSGLRPARWVGTRLLPLAACCFLAVLVSLMPFWWAVGLPLTLVLDGLLIGSICYVGRMRDY